MAAAAYTVEVEVPRTVEASVASTVIVPVIVRLSVTVFRRGSTLEVCVLVTVFHEVGVFANLVMVVLSRVEVTEVVIVLVVVVTISTKRLVEVIVWVVLGGMSIGGMVISTVLVLVTGLGVLVLTGTTTMARVIETVDFLVRVLE